MLPSRRRNFNSIARTSVELPDGSEITVRWEFSPYDPGRTYGPVEACYPPEGGELLKAEIIDWDLGHKPWTRDAEDFLTRTPGFGNEAFERARDDAWAESYNPHEDY